MRDDLVKQMSANEKKAQKRESARLLVTYLKSISLIDKKLLSLCAVVHLSCVLRDQRVEEGIVLLVRARLGTQDATKTLRLLSERGQQ